MAYSLIYLRMLFLIFGWIAILDSVYINLTNCKEDLNLGIETKQQEYENKIHLYQH